MIQTSTARLILAVLPLLCTPLLAAPQEGDPAALALEFSRQFLEGKHAENLEMMTAEMRAASGPERSEPLRRSLLAEHGTVQEIGDAWLEDRIQGYQRYRVPVRFEKSRFDFRVVFDGKGFLAGFFIVPHVRPPQPPRRAPDRGLTSGSVRVTPRYPER